MKWKRSEGAVVLDCGTLRGEVENFDSGSRNQKSWRWQVWRGNELVAKGWSWKQRDAKGAVEARMR